MKIKGKKVSSAYEEVVVLPRQDGNIVFIARAVLDYEPFNKLCPRPKAPLVQYAGQAEPVESLEDPGYLDKLQEWARTQTNWMVITSLRATEDLEWETVNYEDHTTWGNYEDEMKDAGFSPYEINRIVQTVIVANGMDQTKIDEATESFLAARAAAAERANSQDFAQPVTPSGEPASASA